jgi:hypothetical protein
VVDGQLEGLSISDEARDLVGLEPQPVGHGAVR